MTFTNIALGLFLLAGCAGVLAITCSIICDIIRNWRNRR